MIHTILCAETKIIIYYLLVHQDFHSQQHVQLFPVQIVHSKYISQQFKVNLSEFISIYFAKHQMILAKTHTLHQFEVMPYKYVKFVIDF